MILVGSISHAHIFFIVPAVPGYQTAVCVCVNVLGWCLAGGITRLLRDRRPVGAISKGGHCYYRCVCVRDVCVCMCAGGGGLRKCGDRKGKGRVFWSHRQSLLLSAVLVNEDLWKVLQL